MERRVGTREDKKDIKKIEIRHPEIGVENDQGISSVWLKDLGMITRVCGKDYLVTII
jgi:hypothetical protein